MTDVETVQNSVTEVKTAHNSVAGVEIVLNSVMEVKVAQNSMTGVEIAHNSVTENCYINTVIHQETITLIQVTINKIKYTIQYLHFKAHDSLLNMPKSNRSVSLAQADLGALSAAIASSADVSILCTSAVSSLSPVERDFSGSSYSERLAYDLGGTSLDKACEAFFNFS